MKTFMANPAKIDRNGMLLMQKARHWAAWHLKLPRF